MKIVPIVYVLNNRWRGRRCGLASMLNCVMYVVGRFLQNGRTYFYR